jgi:cilia- and flagella-associated protein 57
MKLSYDNNFLFTAGQDGLLIFHDIKDRDPRGGAKREREGVGLPFSDEILTERTEIDNFLTEKEGLENDFNNANQPDSVEKIMKVKRLEDTILKLQEELSNSQVQAKNRYDSLNENKREMENAFEEKIKQLAE